MKLHPLTHRYIELMAAVGLVPSSAESTARTDRILRGHASYSGPRTGSLELSLAGTAMRATISALQDSRTSHPPVSLPNMSEHEMWTMQYVEQRLVMASDFVLSLGKLMEHDHVPIFSWAPLARSTVEVSTMAWRILEPLDKAATSRKDRQLFVARHLNHRIARLRGIPRESVDKYISQVMSPADLASADADQQRKLDEVYDWATAEGIQRVSTKGNPHKDGVFLVEALPSATRRIEEYFAAQADETIGVEGAAALGARWYQDVSVVTHGDPDAVDMRSTATGVGLRSADYALTMTLASVADATHRLQRVVLGQDWVPAPEAEMIQGLAVNLLNAHHPLLSEPDGREPIEHPKR